MDGLVICPDYTGETRAHGDVMCDTLHDYFH